MCPNGIICQLCDRNRNPSTSFSVDFCSVSETTSLNDFEKVWLFSRHNQWPNNCSILFSTKVSTGFMCASFLMSSFISDVVQPGLHSSPYQHPHFLRVDFKFLSCFFLSCPTFRTACHCWSDDYFEDFVFQFHGHIVFFLLIFSPCLSSTALHVSRSSSNSSRVIVGRAYTAPSRL